MLTIQQFIHGQTPADVATIFARAGVVVKDGGFYSVDGDEVVEIERVRERLDWLENRGDAGNGSTS